MSDAKPLSSLSKAGGDPDRPLESIVDEAIDRSENGKVSLRALLKAWGDRSYGPLFILLGFFAGTPLAVIPGAAAIVGVLISVLAVQMLFGMAHPWLPGWALDRSVKQKNLIEARRKVERPLALLDHLITERWPWASGEVMRRIAALVVAVLGFVMVPFDAVPMAVAIPAWTVVVFGVAITARDGLAMIAAMAFAAGVAALAMRIF